MPEKLRNYDLFLLSPNISHRPTYVVSGARGLGRAGIAIFPKVTKTRGFFGFGLRRLPQFRPRRIRLVTSDNTSSQLAGGSIAARIRRLQRRLKTSGALSSAKTGPTNFKYARLTAITRELEML